MTAGLVEGIHENIRDAADQAGWHTAFRTVPVQRNSAKLPKGEAFDRFMRCGA